MEELILSTDPRLLAGLRFNVPLLLLSSLLLRLWRLVKVPPRSGDAGEVSFSRVVSPTSFSCRVIDVSGRFGFIDGFLLMVPVGNSESKPLFSSDRQPLELELDARDKRPLLCTGTKRFTPLLLLLLLLLLHCEGTEETMLPIDPLRAVDSLSSSSLAKSSVKDR